MPAERNDGTYADADWKVNQQVQQAISSDKRLSDAAANVTVSTQDGVVTLSGSVASQNDANMIMRKAQSVQGVKSVNNQMMVNQQ